MSVTHVTVQTDRASARERFKHNMEVYNRGGSRDEYMQPPKREGVVAVSDFADSYGFAKKMADLYRYCEEGDKR